MILVEWRNGINKSIENVIELFKNGKLLLKHNSYGFTCFAFITAFEEIGVAYFIMDRFNKPQPDKLKDFLKHRRKMALTYSLIII